MDDVQLVLLAMLAFQLQTQIRCRIEEPCTDGIRNVQINVLVISVRGIRVWQENASTTEQCQMAIVLFLGVNYLMDAYVGKIAVMGMSVSRMVMVTGSRGITATDGQAKSGIFNVRWQ